MPYCEDYPCCGHEPGDCPDSQGRMKCVECGKRLAKTATSSICKKCLKRMERQDDCITEAGGDFDYSMNY